MIREDIVNQLRSELLINLCEKLVLFAKTSRDFLEPPDAGGITDRPFPEILNAAKCISKGEWLCMMPSVAPPSTVEELRQRIVYVTTIPDLYTADIRYPFAAILHLIPSLNVNGGLRLLWLLIKHLSLLNSAYEMNELISVSGLQPYDIKERTADNIEELLPTWYELEQCTIQLTYRPIIETALNLLETYWENPAAPLPLSRSVFVLPPNAIRTVSPRIYCRHSDKEITMQMILMMFPPLPGDNPPYDPFGMGSNLPFDASSVPPSIIVQGFLDTHRLIFSGGYTCSAQIEGNPVEISPPDDLPPLGYNYTYYLVDIKSTTSIQGDVIHSGSLNFIAPQYIKPIEEFLAMTRKLYSINGVRYWLPWDKRAYNFLWRGAPIIDYSVPEWLMVGQTGSPVHDQSPIETNLTVWGAESITVEVDGSTHVDSSGDISLNHEVLSVWLPRSMEVYEKPREENSSGSVKGGYWYYLPRRYDIHMETTNECGTMNQSFETGVTYPLEARFVGADFGQTISVESISPYDALNYVPRYNYNVPWVNYTYEEMVIDVPFSRDKFTYIRVLAEHNAPKPYFWTDETTGEEPPATNVPARLSYTVNKAATNNLVKGPTATALYNLDGKLGRRGLKYAGVLPVTGPDTEVNIWNYDNDLRASDFREVFAIPFPEAMPNTLYLFEGEIDFWNSTKQKYGIVSDPVPVRFRFRTGNEYDKTLLIHLVTVLPKGAVTGNPVSLNDLQILEIWLQNIIPSVNLRFTTNLEIELGENEDEDDLWDKLNLIVGSLFTGWTAGVCVAVISDAIWDQIDNSITDGVNGRGLIGGRVSYVHGISPHLTAHEIGHAIGYDHVDTGNGEANCTWLNYRFIHPDGNLYPYGSCGSHLFLPGGSPPSPPNALFVSASSPEENRDIMSYSHPRGFDLMKCHRLLDLGFMVYD